MKTRLYTPDGGKAFAKNLALSGGSCLPLLACTLRDTHGAEELIVHGVWEWTLKREMFRYSYFQGTKVLSMIGRGSPMLTSSEWNSVAPEMDVILCPPYSTPAPLLDTSAVHIHLGFVRLPANYVPCYQGRSQAGCEGHYIHASKAIRYLVP